MKKTVIFTALTAALMSMAAAQASEFDGMYIGGKAGLNRSNISGASTASKENTTTMGFEEGYNWDMGGFLLGGSLFVDMNQKAVRTAAPVNSGSSTLGLDAKLGLPSNSLMPYVKLGWDRTTGTGAFPASQFKYTNHLHMGVGVEYKLADNWGVAGEWTNSASKVAGSKLTNDNFTINLNYYLGGAQKAPAPVGPIAATPVAQAPAVAPKAAVVAPAPAPAPKAVVTPPPPAPKESWKIFKDEKPVRIEGANFDTNSAKLRATAHGKLQEIVDFAAQNPNTNFEVSGHTDDRGSDVLNQKLSEKRAASVKAYLVSKGVAADRITAQGYGETKPVEDNKTKAGRAANRRVEVSYTITTEKKVRVIQ